MDRSTARSLVALKIEDPDQTKFTAAVYNKAIDLSEEQFAIDSRAIIKEDTLTAVADTIEISLPTDFMVAVLVRYKGLKLVPTTKADLSWQSGTDWTTITAGTPIAYYINEEDQTIGIVPPASSGEAGAYVTLDYAAIPATITDDSTVLLNTKTFLQYYAPAVVAWAAKEMLTYSPMTQATLLKQSEMMKEYNRYRDQAIQTYLNMADEPIQMKGGRYWTDRIIKSSNNAWSD